MLKTHAARTKKMIYLYTLAAFIATSSLISALEISTQVPIKRVIVWGHAPHRHTHSYIHAAYERTFKHMGLETSWISHNIDLSNQDLSGTLFITEGLVDDGMPLRNDCWYIIHNCKEERYKKLLNAGRCIIMQVYTHDCLAHTPEKIEDYIYCSPEMQTIWMPWATDLLPHEIDEMKQLVMQRTSTSNAWFIGSIWDDEVFGNIEEISAFKRACEQDSVQFLNRRYVSLQDHARIIRNASIAPAIQGKWQCQKGYIPCRIFKNISYGNFGVTNSPTVADLFKGMIVYNPDAYQLYFDAKKFIASSSLETLFAQMDFVRDHHTYVQRIKHLLNFLAQVQEKAAKEQHQTADTTHST